jgi:hypothetical protein
MTEQSAEANKIKDYVPHGELIDYIHKRLKLSKEMETTLTEEREFSSEMNRQDKSLRTKKVRILDEIIFPAMADLVFFFEAVNKEKDLQDIFRNDIEDLLGIKHKESQMYGFMFHRLLRSILAIEKANSDPFIKKSVQMLNNIVFPSYKDNILTYVKRNTNESEVLSLFESLDRNIEYENQYHVERALEETTRKSNYDFQLRLNHILQGIVFDKVRPYLSDIFQLQEAQIAVKDDIRRAWAWTGTLAYNITEKKEAPHRTFDFDTNELLK